MQITKCVICELKKGQFFLYSHKIIRMTDLYIYMRGAILNSLAIPSVQVLKKSLNRAISSSSLEIYTLSRGCGCADTWNANKRDVRVIVIC